MVTSTQTVIINITVQGGAATRALSSLGSATGSTTQRFSGMAKSTAFLHNQLVVLGKALLSMVGVLIAFNVFVTLPQRIAEGFVKLSALILRSAEEINKTIIQTAGLLASFAEFGDTAESSFLGAINASKQLQLTFAQLAAKSLATAEDMQRGFQVFVARGGLGFVRGDLQRAAETTAFLVNLTLALTGELQKERQIYTEIDAFLQAQQRAGAVVARLIAAQVGDLKVWLEQQRRAGTLLESLQRMFGGINRAAAELGETASGMVTSITGVAGVLNSIAYRQGAFPVIRETLGGWRSTLIDVVQENGNMKMPMQTLSRDTESILRAFAALQEAIIVVVRSLESLVFALTGASTEAEVLERIARSVMSLGIAASALFAGIAKQAAALELGKALKAARSIEEMIPAIGIYLEKAHKSGAIADETMRDLGERFNYIQKLMQEPIIDENQVRRQMQDLLRSLDEINLVGVLESIPQAWSAGFARAERDIENMVANMKREITAGGMPDILKLLGLDQVDEIDAKTARMMDRLREQYALIYTHGNEIGQTIIKRYYIEKDILEQLTGHKIELEEAERILKDIWNYEIVRAGIAKMQEADRVRQIYADWMTKNLEKLTKETLAYQDTLIELSQRLEDLRLTGDAAAIAQLEFERAVAAIPYEIERTSAAYAELVEILEKIRDLALERAAFGTLIDDARKAIDATQRLTNEYNAFYDQLYRAAARGAPPAVLRELRGVITDIELERQRRFAENLALIAKLTEAKKRATEEDRVVIEEQIKQLERANAALVDVATTYDWMMFVIQLLQERFLYSLVGFATGVIAMLTVITTAAEAAAVTIAQNLGGAIEGFFRALMYGGDALASFRKMLGDILVQLGTAAVSMGALSLIISAIPWLSELVGGPGFGTAQALALIAAGTAAIAAGVAIGGGGGAAAPAAARGGGGGEAQSQMVYLEPYFQRQGAMLAQLTGTVARLSDTLDSFDTKPAGIIIKENLSSAGKQVTQTLTKTVAGNSTMRSNLAIALAGGA